MRDPGLENGLKLLIKYIKTKRLNPHALWNLIRLQTRIPVSITQVRHLLNGNAKTSPPVALAVALAEITKNAIPVKAWIARESKTVKSVYKFDRVA